jgi:hypothetical protein
MVIDVMKTKLQIAIAAIIATSSLQAAYIVDPSFESNPFAGGLETPATSLTDWTVVISATNPSFPFGIANSNSSGYGTTGAGDQYIALDGTSGSADNWVEQKFTGLTIGDTYTFTIDVANFAESQSQASQVHVFFTSLALDVIAYGPTPTKGLLGWKDANTTPLIWNTNTYTFTALQDTEYIYLQFDSSVNLGEDTYPAIDNLSLEPVPEVSAAILSVLSLGGFLIRRKRAQIFLSCNF